MADNIIRDPTPQELRDFVPIANAKGRIKDPKAKFNEELAKEQLKANKKGLPFASHAARNDYLDELDAQMKSSLRKNGYVKGEDIKLPKIDWSKYSDLKNFEVVEDDEKYDEQLSKRYNKAVSLKFKTYKYKGYSNTYRVMEDPFEAIKRAK